MRQRTLRLAFVTLLASPVVLGGCLGKGTVEPTRFYLLDALPMPGSATTDAPSIGVGPVSLPDYIDRPQIVTRSPGNEIRLAEFARWGAPLKEHVPRVLAENLSALLGTEKVAVFPWKAADLVDYQVAVDILRFDADEAGNAALSARWSVLRKGGKEALRSKRSEYSERAAASGYDGLTGAESRALQSLSREIAGVIQGDARKGPGR